MMIYICTYVYVKRLLYLQHMRWLFTNHICWLMFSYLSVRYAYSLTICSDTAILVSVIPLVGFIWMVGDLLSLSCRSFFKGRSSCKWLGQFSGRNASLKCSSLLCWTKEILAQLGKRLAVAGIHEFESPQKDKTNRTVICYFLSRILLVYPLGGA